MPFILAALSRAGLWLTEAANTLSHALLWLLPALIPFCSSCWAMPRQWIQFSIITRTSTSVTGCPLLPTALLSLCFCMKPEGFSFTTWQLWMTHWDWGPETQLESAGLSLQVCPCGKHIIFWCQSSIFKSMVSAAKGWAVKFRNWRCGVPACCSMLQEKKIFCYCYFS